MKIIKVCILVFALMINNNTKAQQAPSTNINGKSPVKKDGLSSRFSISAGAGVAGYFGDLLEYSRFYSQQGFSFGAGAAYAFTNHISIKADLGVQQVKAADSKNTGAQFKARNLSFKSNVFDISVSAEYNILSMKKYPFTPYLTGGVGVMFFNPYANDITGKKQYLRELGTEGQGLAGYPGMYSKTSVIFPAGFGFKFDVSNKLMLQAEFNYRFTRTDYLDDVSSSGYPPKALLDARNPITATFTYRGNEAGAGPYPTNLKLPRGNPNNKDGYYTTQFKVVYKFKTKSKRKVVEAVEPVVILLKDTDGDGVVDNEDKCVDIAGKASLQGCPDTDGDGIADKDDKCKDVAGVLRYDGCPIPDSDGDGLNDEIDNCKTEKGLKENNGCPIHDKDGDGIADTDDKCPDTKGRIENNGCPLPFVEGAELIDIALDSMTYRIYFDINRALLLPDAFKTLKRIVDILKADNSLHINITGHADTTGTYTINMNLSAERAKVTQDYFLSYYIAAGRIKSSFYGSSRPIDVIQQWRNRRVEITISKK